MLVVLLVAACAQDILADEYQCLDSACERYCVRQSSGKFTPGACQSTGPGFASATTCNADSTYNSFIWFNSQCSGGDYTYSGHQPACRAQTPGIYVGSSLLTSCNFTDERLAATFGWHNTAAPSCIVSQFAKAHNNPCCETQLLNYGNCGLDFGCNVEVDFQSLQNARRSGTCSGAGVSTLLSYLDTHNCFSGTVSRYAGAQELRVPSRVDVVLQALSGGCTIPFAVNGSLSDWQDVGKCSSSCGNGTVSQMRTCTNPAPQQGGLSCEAQQLGLTARVTSCADYRGCAQSSTAGDQTALSAAPARGGWPSLAAALAVASMMVSAW